MARLNPQFKGTSWSVKTKLVFLTFYNRVITPNPTATFHFQYSVEKLESLVKYKSYIKQLNIHKKIVICIKTVFIEYNQLVSLLFALQKPPCIYRIIPAIYKMLE